MASGGKRWQAVASGGVVPTPALATECGELEKRDTPAGIQRSTSACVLLAKDHRLSGIGRVSYPEMAAMLRACFFRVRVLATLLGRAHTILPRPEFQKTAVRRRYRCVPPPSARCVLRNTPRTMKWLHDAARWVWLCFSGFGDFFRKNARASHAGGATTVVFSLGRRNVSAVRSVPSPVSHFCYCLIATASIYT